MNYIIDFIDTATDKEIQDYLTANQANVLKVYNNLSKIYLVTADNSPAITDLVSSVHIDLEVSLTVNNSEYTTTSFNDNSQEILIGSNNPNEWWKISSFNTVDFEKDAQTFQRRSYFNQVYLVDSGIATFHNEFLGKSVQNLFTFNSDYTDNLGHGTQLASVISGQICGITNACIKSVKVLDKGVSTKLSDLVAAFDAIYYDWLTLEGRVSFINISWTIPANEYIESKLRFLLAQGLYVICSAGNTASPIDNLTPARMPEVITVGSYNENLVPSVFSNYSLANSAYQLDGFAPGENIYVATLDNKYKLTSGTSIATAIMTACLIYNFHTLTGKYGETLINLPKQLLAAISLSRRDLLTLDDPYRACPNCIATMDIEFVVPNSKTSLGEIIFTLKYDNMVVRRLYNPYDYPTAEYTRLPPGLSIENGVLLGKTSNVDNLPYRHNNVSLRLTSKTGEITQYTLTILTYDDINYLIDQQIPLSQLDQDLVITPTEGDGCIFFRTLPGCVDYGCPTANCYAFMKLQFCACF
jgi:subtilisin family serine protease